MNTSTTIHVDFEQASNIGKARQRVHSGNTTRRFYDDPNKENVLGVMAELAFEDLTGIPMNRGLFEGGDGNVDFIASHRGVKHSIDVKAAKNPVYLFVKAPDIDKCADLLVLARVDESEVTFIGWSTHVMMRKCPKKDFGYGILNYYLPSSSLFPIGLLWEGLDP